MVTLPVSAEAPAYQTADWTFMVYMDADNNLESFGIWDFMELSSVGSTAQVNIVVQFDRIGGYNATYGNWMDARRFRITRGMTPDAANGTSIGEVNMGSPQTLISFVQWAKTTYPAQHYALVLWDHGSGWRVQIADTQVQKGVAYDDSSSGDGLNAPELRSAYHTITSGGTDPLGLVGFDACFMGMIEVDGQLIPYAEVRVGSEESEPGEGWPYDAILADLTANPGMTPDRLGAAIVNHYYAYYGSETLSAVNLGPSYAALNIAVDHFALALIERGGPYTTAISTARSYTQQFDNPSFVDLYDFAYEVRQRVSEPGIQAAATQVMSAITGTVVAERHGTYWAGVHGISIYFPGSKTSFDSKYDGSSNWLQFTQNTNWDEWLHNYFSVSSLPAPTLLEPTSGTLSSDGTPTFSWNAVAGARAYRIQVDNDWNFVSPVINTTRTGTRMTPSTALGSKTFYWRVKTRDANGNWGMWSDTWVLTLDRVKPARSTLATPTNGAIVPTNLPVFEWANVSPDVAFYRIQIDNTSTFASPEINEVASSTRYIPPMELSGSKYFWRIQAYDWAGNRSSWSAGWKVKIDTTAAAIVPVQSESRPSNDEPAVEPTVPFIETPIAEPTLMSAEQSITLQTVESDSAFVRQDGLWTAHDTAAASSGRYLYNGGASPDVLTLRFSGTHLELVYVRHPALGTLAVEIDGVLIQTIDSRADDTEFGACVAFALAAGQHTVRVYALSGTVAIDSFAVETALEPMIDLAVEPTIVPTTIPTVEVTMVPTLESTIIPTGTPIPTVEPTMELTLEPTIAPTDLPTVEPTLPPTLEPTTEPTIEPTAVPPVEPTSLPEEPAPPTDPTAESSTS